jgi:TRAP-type mannitol/chloroaromatic compound transport system permease small subunit
MSEVATWGAALAIVILMIAQIFMVVLRYVFSGGYQWGQDLLVYLFMCSSVLPMTYVLVKNLSVRVDVFYARYSQTTKTTLDRWGLLLLFLPVAISTVYASWGPLINSWQIREGSATFGGLPGLYLLKTLQALVFIALAICALLLGLKKRPWRYDSSPPEA